MTAFTRRLRPATAAPFRALIAHVGEDLREITAALASRTISTPEWGGLMLEALAHGHAEAGYLGRVRAGDTAPFDLDDRRFGALVAQEEAPYLNAFEQDLLGGKYTQEDGTLDVERIQRRAALYVARIYGTANEALSLTIDEPIWWRLGEPETSHCRECPALAAGSPYAPGTLPTVPLGNATSCLSQCLCWLETASGLIGFHP